MESFTTNQSALCNQGQAFICLHCFHRVTFTKKHSDDCVQKITQKIPFMEQHLEIRDNNIQRVTFTK